MNNAELVIADFKGAGFIMEMTKQLTINRRGRTRETRVEVYHCNGGDTVLRLPAPTTWQLAVTLFPRA